MSHGVAQKCCGPSAAAAAQSCAGCSETPLSQGRASLALPALSSFSPSPKGLDLSENDLKPSTIFNMN